MSQIATKLCSTEVEGCAPLEAPLVNIVQAIENALSQYGRVVRRSAVIALLGLAAWGVLPAIIPGAGMAYAQNTNATIRGQVFDPTGALVANANVVITNKNTGVTVFNGTTDSAGAFVAPQVIPG